MIWKDPAKLSWSPAECGIRKENYWEALLISSETPSIPILPLIMAVQQKCVLSSAGLFFSRLGDNEIHREEAHIYEEWNRMNVHRVSSLLLRIVTERVKGWLLIEPFVNLEDVAIP